MSPQPEFTDAEAMHRKHPDRFWSPSLDPEHRWALNNLKAGDVIKVACAGERFWALIVERPERGKFIATVDNGLLNAELNYGDRIEVEDRHIYTYMTAREMAHSPKEAKDE
jgi:hypothetical protein